MNFLIERLKVYIRDLGISQSCILSVCNVTKNDDIYDITQRIMESLIIACHRSVLFSVIDSAKDGIGIQEIFNAIINFIPPPKINEGMKARGLIFDSTFDSNIRNSGVSIWETSFNV